VPEHASSLPPYLNLESKSFLVFAPAALKAGRDARAPGFKGRIHLHAAISLHRMLTAYFIAGGCGADSDAPADVTLDRIARKIDGGEEVRN